MDGKGWKPEYGISREGIEILGFVEALPREARREMLETIARICRREGYVSLHDDIRAMLEKANDAPPQRRSAKVIPLFRRG